MTHADSDRPLVTVVILSYNHERYIAQCIESVLAQEVEGLEILVLDDCSPDGTDAVVRRYLDDPRLTYVRNESNLGMVENSNKAYRSGRGKYLVILPSDDFWYPGHLAPLVEALEQHPECSLAYSQCRWIDDNGQVLKTAVHPGHRAQSYCGGRDELADLLIYDNYITPPAALLRRSVLETVGVVDPQVTGAGDWDLYVRFAQHNPQFAFVASPSVGYRVHETQYSQQFYASAEPLLDHLRILEKALESPRAVDLVVHADVILAHLERRAGGFPPQTRAPLDERIEAVRRRFYALRVHGFDASDEPLVSVIMPTKDRPDFLSDALRSVVAQTYGHWEAVIVNDGGCPVEEIVRRLAPDARIVYLSHDASRGLPAARNSALRAASGEVICYLDDDDRFEPHHLQTVVDALCSGGAEFVYTDAEYIVEEVKEGRREDRQRGMPYAHDAYSKERLHVQNYIPVNSWAHRRALLDRVGLFDETLSALEDWDLLLRISRATEPQYLRRTTVQVRLREAAGDNMSGRERKNFPGLFRTLYRRYDDFGSTWVRDERVKALNGLDHAQVAERSAQQTSDNARARYAHWVELHELTEGAAQILAERMLAWTQHPAVHLLCVVQPGDEPRLAQTLESLAQQFYKGWGLSVVARHPAPDDGWGGTGALEWLQVPADQPLGAALLEAIQATGADWVGLIEPGDRLAPQLLLRLGDYVNRYPQWQLIYCDHDHIDAAGGRGTPHFKPDFNLDLLRSTPYMGPFAVIRREALEAADGYRWLGTTGVYDLALRIYEGHGGESIGHIAEQLFHVSAANLTRYDAGESEAHAREALTDHFLRTGIAAQVRQGYLPMSFFVEYQHDTRPKVSIIIPTRDQPDYLIPCVESVLGKTDYPDFELIIVDNDTVDPMALEFLEEIQERDPRVRVIPYSSPFNFSAMINLGARHAAGDYLLLLNNDTAVLQDAWLRRMMDHAQRPEVGVVGARLLFPDQRVQHAGVIVGMGGSAHHVGAGAALDEPGPMGRAQMTQNYSAVTGACLLTRKSLFDALGGLDETRFGVLFNDVDYCLRVGEQHKLVVWTPFATLVHHASVSVTKENFSTAQQRKSKEVTEFAATWTQRMADDPAYNRNLSLNALDWRPEIEVVGKWDPHFHDRPRLLAAPVNASGSPRYRVLCPLLALERAGKAQIGILPEETRARIPTLWEVARLAPDTLLAQMYIHDHQLSALRQYRVLDHLFKVFALDDLVTDVPAWSPFAKQVYPDIERRLRAALRMSDRLVVSTEPLREAYRGWIDDVRVVPNYLERRVWDPLQSRRRRSDKPRVGWAGAQQHQGDLELLLEVVKATAQEVDWVFMGMWLKAFEPYVKEFHQPVPFEEYPAKLATLDLDLAVAPLEAHPFNEAKSNLRLLEFGALGWPVVCSDIEPYRGAPVCRVANDPQAWITALRERVHDWDAMAAEGDRLREWIQSRWMLEDHFDDWLAALTPSSAQPAARAAAQP